MSLLINRDENIEEKLKRINFVPEIIGPYFELLDRDTVVKYKGLGFQIFPWTINVYDDIQRIKDYGVDGLITDYPNKLLQPKHSLV